MTQKIYLASKALEGKIIGRRFPQVLGSDSQLLFEENNKRDENEKFKIIPIDGFSVKIAKSAKLSDTLSSFMAFHSPIVSEEFFEFLQDFLIPDFKLIPIKVYRNSELVIEKKYFILHFFGNDIENINFRQSTFDYFTGGKYFDRSLLQFDDYHHYLDKVKLDGRISLAIIQKVVMKKTLKHDLFFLDIFMGDTFFVSEELMEGIKKQKLTGFCFEEVGYVED
jgi:hypothetical protein